MRPAFGEWDVEANERFKDLTWDKKLVAKVTYYLFLGRGCTYRGGGVLA